MPVPGPPPVTGSPRRCRRFVAGRCSGVDRAPDRRTNPRTVRACSSGSGRPGDRGTRGGLDTTTQTRCHRRASRQPAARLGRRSRARGARDPQQCVPLHPGPRGHRPCRRRATRRALPHRPDCGGWGGRGAYNLPTPTRGRVTVGPLRLTLTDPFGITRRHSDDSLVDELLVHPRVHALGTLPDAVAQGGAEVSQVWRTDTDGAFRSVREYRHGDDPRRIHWKSTARTGSVMVREHEQRSSAPVTVFFDTRRSVHDVASFERGVEVAASVVCALEDRRRPYRLVTSEGVLLDAAQLGVRTTLGEELALLEPTSDPESPIPHDAVSAAGPERSDVTSPGALTVMILGSGPAGATPGTTPRHARGGPIVAVLTRGSGAAAIPVEAVPIDATDMSRFPEAWDEASRKWSSVEGGSRWTQRVAARR
ncbi:MAG: DUF58 domain-containing protein [Acidimicrobiia bacterium]|nr:DUF58 domain-containing protein [Acidimicrobiia bacterium]